MADDDARRRARFCDASSFALAPLASIAQAFGVDLVSYGIQAEGQYANGTLPRL
jgi:hypothetical protein